ncbi:MAG: malto-oligosyltrehalose synthase, partial [Acidimicrobiales bacterium]
MAASRVPGSTYRLQLHRDFTFDDAAALAPYLASLGVTHVYTSPQLQARQRSTHGYDVVDHSRVADDLGGADGRERFVAALRSAGLGQVLDIVPNHMAIGTERNRWWWSLLREGPHSPVAAAFDIDWDPPESKLRSTVLLPVLADHYGRALEAGELWLEPLHADDPDEPIEVVVRYGESMFPLRVGSLAEATGTDDWQSAIDAVNASVDVLDALLDAQFYRLAYWRTGAYELDYRRFFDVTDLAGLRVEDPTVFALTHDLIGSWIADGSVDGVRVDHPDGLRDPAAYFERLRALAGDSWVVVEKILEPGEALPAWPVDGTTGYDAMTLIGGLFLDDRGIGELTDLASELTGEAADFDQVAAEAKAQVLTDLMATEVHRLAAVFVEVCEQHRRYRDYARRELEEVITAVLVAFDVYRTYVVRSADRRPQDLVRIDGAIARAAKVHPDLDGDLLDFFGSILRADDGLDGPIERDLRLRFQQLAGPTMAKGVEDTAIYRHLAVAAADEVGGNPASPAVSPAHFHDATRARNQDWPAGMLALTTHDTTRSEDVRARLSLLTEIPDLWSRTVRGWFALNGRHRGPSGPDGLTEYLIYLTLVGAHPLPIDRAREYLTKAMREAKRSTSWLRPDDDVERDAQAFLEAILADRRFTRSLDELVAPLLGPARTTSLAMKLTQLTSPGVPDLYQGSELWDLSLVDPDNRRPVDYAARRAALGVLPATAALLPPLDHDDLGLGKLFVVKRALRLRSAIPAAFAPGAGYEPLAAQGAKRDHVVAFVRGGEAITVVPRLTIGLGGDWADTTITLPDGE